MTGVATRIGISATADLRALARGRWSWLAILLGPLAVGFIAARALNEPSGLAREDSFRSGAASLMLLGGLFVALTLGANAVKSGSTSGRLGLLLAGGAGRDAVSWSLVVSRAVALAAVFAVWGVALQIGSLSVGLGVDGPLAVHVAASYQSMLIALVAALAAATAVGPVAAWVFGGIVYVIAQAAVNLKAAADADALGTADPLGDALYYLWPRTVTSPMIADLQLRDAAGPAAPQIDINQNIVTVPAAGVSTVIWTLMWLGILAWIVSAGFRRRGIR